MSPKKTKKKPSKAALSPKQILLSDVIEGLRKDLLASAAERPDDWEPLFSIEEATVEVHVGFVRDAKFKSGIKVLVASIGGDLQETSEVTHKISLRLTPVRMDADQPRTVPARDMHQDDALVRGKE